MPETYPFGPHPYLVLKLARELFRKSPGDLDPPERKRIDHVAVRQSRIEQRILTSTEAAGVVIPDSSLDEALAEIRSRYSTLEEYLADLARSGLDPQGLRLAVARDLRLNAVLERVGNQAPEVSATDIEIYYLIHRAKFQRPENRTLRHILITVDDRVLGSERLMAYRKIDEIRQQLLREPKAFSDFALRYSECPTAVSGGLLGSVSRGKLYPELEAVAFSLRAGELSKVVESPLGFHLVHCVSIESAGTAPLAAAQEQIRAHLNESRRNTAQKAWIAGLFRQIA